MQPFLRHALALIFILPLGTPSALASAQGPEAVPVLTPSAITPAAQRFVPVHRQRGKVYIGLNTGLSYMFGESARMEGLARSGPMLEAVSGWKVNRYLSVELAGLAGFHSDENPSRKMSVIFGAIAATKIYILPNAKRIRPYAQVGLGLYGATTESNEEAAGIGLNGGIGMTIKLNPVVGLAVDANYRAAYWEGDSGSMYFQSLMSLSAGLRIFL